MLFRSVAMIATLVAIELVGPASTVQAGPLIDWLFGGRRQPPAYPVGAPVPLGNGYGAAPGYATGYPGYAAGYPGYTAGYPGYAAGYPGYAGYPNTTAGMPSSVYPNVGNPSYATGYPGYATGSYSAGYAPFGMNVPSPVPNTGYAANLGTYYGSQLPVIGPNGAGYRAQMPTGIAAATLPQSPQTFSYVPNFNSSALRAPVTYYRPLLTTDPNTGSQVVAMAPCTSYQYLTQRVPALGQSALYGNYQPPQQLPMQSVPSYTLPSGGIPLASNSMGTSTFGGGAALGYSPYSSYLVSPPAIVGTPTYPTSPLGSNYYGNGSTGGSTGSIYSQSVPGLVAPPAATYTTPSTQPGYAQPSYTQPNYTQPGYTQPGYTQQPSGSTSPGSVMPPPSSNFSDPGNLPPSLPPTGTLRPKIQSIIPEATPSGAESAQKARTQERTMLSDPAAREVPVMNPIPAPEGMEKPTWSPGLLRNEDMTALRPVTRSSQLAGQSKKIHWASFEQELTLDDSPSTALRTAQPQAAQPQATQAQPTPRATATQPGQLQLQPSAMEPVGMTSLRPVVEPAKRYDTSGWKASR